MAITQSFRAGSGSYQYVRPLALNITAVPGMTTVTETYSASGGIQAGGGSIADLTTDSLVVANFALPNNVAGLVIDRADITATGTLQLTMSNITISTITPAAGTQVNLVVL